MTTHPYQNFDLLITRTAGGYNARVIHAPAGQANGDFVLPFAPAELRRFFWLTDHALRHLRPEHEETMPALDPQTFGARLYDAVFTGTVGSVFRRSLDLANGDLRIRLRLDDVPELADLPWEYLYATDLARHLALSQATPLVRYLQLAQPEPRLAIQPPLRILAVVANPTDVRPLAVEQEWQQLAQVVTALQSRQHLVLERLEKATLSALQERLRRTAVHVLHFIGHGVFDTALNRGGLSFEDEAGTHRLVDATDLATLLHDHQPLRLVFLNACQGAQGGRSDPFAGVAQKLVQQGVPSVVAMQFPVSDRAAIALAREFYSALDGGYPIDAALSEARKAIHLAGEAREWGTPVLFSRSPDNQLVAVEPPHATAQPPAGTAATAIHSGGGAVIQGNVMTGGGDFVGHDKITVVVQRPEDAIQFQQQQQRLAALRDGTFTRLPFEPETVLIPAGVFWMGSDTDASNEAPRHQVSLPDFRIGKYPVTNANYALFLKHTGHTAPNKPRWFLQEPPPGKAQHPVTGVSWYDAAAYCAWLTQETGRPYHLPSEAEWEKVACWHDASTHALRYPWGDAWHDGCCHVNHTDTIPVDAYVTGMSPYGCYDMLGNAQEWTRTLWGSQRETSDYAYPYQSQDGREDVTTAEHLVRVYYIYRGGCYRDQSPAIHGSMRGVAGPESAVSWRGFRLMMKIV